MNPNRLNTGAMVGLGLFLILAIGLFAYVMMNRGEENTVLESDNELETTTAEPTTPETRITGLHDVTDGVHTVVGTYVVPTPCHRLTVEPFFTDGDRSNVELSFNVLGPENEDEMCAQVVTDAPFKVTFEAPEDAVLSGTLNGEPIVLNLAPAGEDDNLDEFEEFYKG